jgi:YceI-like domain.
MLTTLPHITKYLWTLPVLLLWFADPDPEREATVRVAPESEVVISGTTNVNQFTCKYNLQELELPIRLIYDEKAQHILFKNAKLKLANDCFDCGGKAINKDFRELLQTKSHPEVELKLLYVNPPQPEKETISVGMEIKIAGVTRKYESVLNCEQKSGICVKGTLSLKLTDFGLEPPRKVLGMIKVDNEILVHMSLQMKEI